MLFGHQSDDTSNTTGADAPNTVAPADTNPLALDPATGSSFPATQDDNTTGGAPLFGTTPAAEPQVSLEDNPLGDETSQTVPQVSSESTSEPATPVVDTPQAESAPAGSDDLLTLKQQALGDLAPLVSHLDQTPEEKFRTTMMMIQSTDNQDLIKEAYAAAQAIPDEKARAQALLDVVNEINYFTQKSKEA
jgi:hypothetical protein